MKFLLLIFITFISLDAFELDISSGKENTLPLSIINLRDTEPFFCKENIDDLKNVKTIICAFNRAPRERFKSLNNNFFSISSAVKSMTFFITIRAHKKMKLKPIIFNLIEDTTIYQANITMSNHWIILGYEGKMPFLKMRTHLIMDLIYQLHWQSINFHLLVVLI